MSNTKANSTQVQLAERSYDVTVYPGDLAALAADIANKVAGRAALVTSRRIHPLHGADFLAALKAAGVAIEAEDVIVVDDGERAKTMATVSAILDGLVARRHTRRSTVIALGGGVIGDLAGFAAAIFLRGIPYVQVPTTVVAMVDSAVGGKTGVDHPHGKNLIGAFHQPLLVTVHPEYLGTLDDHNRRGGLAEVIKYGVIRDSEFFSWLESGGVQAFLALDPAAVSRAVLRSCEIKAAIVSEDEFESEGGVRAHLNFGHTFGHGIEAVVLRHQLEGTEAGPVGRLKAWWSREQVHGQCIAVGMACAMDLAVRLKMISTAEVMRLEKLLLTTGLPTRIPPGVSPHHILDAMATDKKAVAGTLRFVLPTAIGSVEVRGDIPKETVLEVLIGRTDETRN
jgi:3-dehydroquinate synthase